MAKTEVPTSTHIVCSSFYIHTWHWWKILSPKPKNSCNRHATNNKPLSTITCRTVPLKTFAAYLYMVYWGCAWGWQPHHLCVPNVTKSGSLEPSGPNRAFTFIEWILSVVRLRSSSISESWIRMWKKCLWSNLMFYPRKSTEKLKKMKP